MDRDGWYQYQELLEKNIDGDALCAQGTASVSAEPDLPFKSLPSQRLTEVLLIFGIFN
jgi:hypothetical protein